jgi:hypothetical protein
MRGGKRDGAGRKPVSIDMEQLETVCGLQCTHEEVAGFFRVTVRTIERRCQRDPAFADVMNRGRAKGRISVRRGLFQQAAKGNAQALIFLAKNELGYRDPHSNEHSRPNAGPDLTKPMKFTGSMMELLELYRELTLGTPPARG